MDHYCPKLRPQTTKTIAQIQNHYLRDPYPRIARNRKCTRASPSLSVSQQRNKTCTVRMPPHAQLTHCSDQNVYQLGCHRPHRCGCAGEGGGTERADVSAACRVCSVSTVHTDHHSPILSGRASSPGAAPRRLNVGNMLDVDRYPKGKGCFNMFRTVWVFTILTSIRSVETRIASLHTGHCSGQCVRQPSLLKFQLRGV